MPHLKAAPRWEGALQGAQEKSEQTNQEQKGGNKPPAKDQAPDLTKIRKVFLQVEEWADEDYAREKYAASLEKHTCLKAVDSVDEADAILKWQNRGAMGTAMELVTKKDKLLWNKSGVRPPLGALKKVVGCPQ